MGSDRFPGLPSSCRRCRPQDGPSRPACRRSPRRRSPTSSCRSMPFAARRPAVPSRWLSTCGSTSSGRLTRRVRVQVDSVCGAAWPVGPGQRRRLPQTQAAARVEPSQSHTAEDLLGGREQRQLSRKRISEPRLDDEDGLGRRRRGSRPRRGSTVSTAAPRKANATIQVPCNVRAFSEAIGLPASEVLK